MGFLAPAIPWAVRGGALLGGWLGGKKAQSSAQARSPEEQAALGGAQGAAGTLARQGSQAIQQGQQVFSQGLPMLGNAGNYWQTLLQGNRGAMALATAGPRAAITDESRGAARGIERSGARGAVRDLAKAELSRDTFSKLAGLTTGVQPAAAQNLAAVGGQIGDLGLGLSRLGYGGQEASANIFSRLLGEGFENRKYARGEGEKAGKSIGSLIFDVLSGTIGKFGKPKMPSSKVGISGPIPGLPTTPGPF